MEINSTNNRHVCVQPFVKLAIVKAGNCQLFKKFNLDQNYLDFKISCFAIQDQVNHLLFSFFKATLDWIRGDSRIRPCGGLNPP